MNLKRKSDVRKKPVTIAWILFWAVLISLFHAAKGFSPAAHHPDTDAQADEVFRNF